MMIKRIQFNDLKYLPAQEMHRAAIILTTDTSTMCLLCHSDLPEAASREDIALELVRDALRQVRQMPEYRRDQDAVQIADSATQEFRQTA